MSKKRIIIPLLIAMGLLLTAGVIYADMKMNKPVHAWDVKIDEYTHSLQDMPFDCSWIPFWYEFNWDGDVYPTGNDLVARYYSTTVETAPYPLDACPDDGYPLPKEPGTYSSTQWASVFEYAIYYDNPEAGLGYGFKWSRNWELVECDRDGDGVWEATGPGNDLIMSPPQSRTIIVDDPGDINLGFEVLAQNVATGTESVGNAELELITTLFVNLDTDCDGDINEPFLSLINEQGAVCFYAEAQTPCPPDPGWGTGNIQARVSRLGGEVTINFHQLEGLTPVELSSFTGRWYEDPSRLLMWGAVAAVLGGAAVGALLWRTRPAQR
jgi:hypothetical protein